MISILTRICFLLAFVGMLGCTDAPSEKRPQEEPMDSTTHFNDSTEAV